MNKKILIAVIGAAMAGTSIAAAADLKISGRVYRQMAVSGPSGFASATSDDGHSRLQFDASNDSGFARLAWDTRGGVAQRELMAGLNVGGGKFDMGRLASAYAGAVSIDAYTATMWELRTNAGSKVSSFNNGRLGFRTKAGDMKVNVQYGPGDVDGGAAAAPYEVALTGKAGDISFGLGAHTNNSGNASMGLKGKMKFGDIGVALAYESADGAYIDGGAAGTAQAVYALDVSMKMGGMGVNATYGNNPNTGTLMRLALTKKMGKKTRVHAGYINYNNASIIGGGVRVDF